MAIDSTLKEQPPTPDFPMARSCPYHPPAQYEELREKGPMAQVRLYDGRLAWLVTGHSAARALLADPRVSSDRQKPGFPMVAARLEVARQQRTALIGVDPPEHTAQRRMLIPSFTVRRVNELRPGIQRAADALIDEILAQGPPADLFADFALALPSQVACRLFGIPYDGHSFFDAQFRQMLHADSSVQEVGAARSALVGYLDELVTVKQDRPEENTAPGMLDELIEQQLQTGGLDRGELVSLTMLLLLSGYETTVSMIATGILTLLEHPDQADLLRRDPSLAPGLVDELMRFLSIADGIARVATEDIEVEGRRIAAGDGLFIATAAANRDATLYPDPARFDITRSARQHIGFGFGIHQCIGQNLARAELEITFGTLFARIPSLRLAVPVEEIPMKGAGTVQGVTSCPVTW